MSKIFAEMHQISAGSQFTGEVPDTLVHLQNGLYVYKPATKGGLFVLPTSEEDVPETIGFCRLLKSLRVTFGGQSSWTLKVVGTDSDYTWLSGTTETSLVVTDKLELLPQESLKLETVGASTAMAALMDYELSRRV